MPDILYLIWALLPLALLWITIKASAKAVTKTGKREYPKAYLSQLLLTTGIFLIAILIDSFLLPPIADELTSFGLDARLIRWLIYPALLAGVAVSRQVFIDKARKEEDAEKTARRMKYAKN